MNPAMPFDPRAILEDIERLRPLALRLAADPDIADDVVADVTTTNRHGIAHPFAYLRKVVVNAAAERRRAADKRRRREQAVARRGTMPSTAEVAERAAVQRDVVEAVLALPTNERNVVLLHYFDDRSFESIAATEGCPAATIRSRHRRALEELRRSLDRRHRGERSAWALPLGVWAQSTSVKASSAIVAATIAVLVLFVVGWAVLDRGVDEADLPPGDRATAISASGRVAAQRSTAASATTTKPTSVRPTPAIDPLVGSFVGGRVVDEGDRPIAGARVTIFPAVDGKLFDIDQKVESGWRFTAVSAADGTFRAPVDPEWSRSSLIATAAGHGARHLRDVDTGCEIVVRLDPPLVLESRIRDLAKEPIAGAKITWSILFGGAQLIAAGKTGPDGRVRIVGPIAVAAELEVGRFAQTIVVEADGFAPCLDDTVPEPKAGVVTRDFFLVRGATIIATIVDAETRAPIPDVPCELWSAETAWTFQGEYGKRYESSASLRTLARAVGGENGEVFFSNVPAWGVEIAGRHNVQSLVRGLGGIEAAPAGYARASVALPLPDDGAVVRVEVPCRPAVAIRGRIVDAEGSPVPDVVVRAWTADCRTIARETNDPARDVRTDARGEYILPDVPVISQRSVEVEIDASLNDEVFASVSLTVEKAKASEPVAAPNIVLLNNRPFVDLLVLDGSDHPCPGAVASIGGISAVTDKSGRCRLYPHKYDGKTAVRILVRARGFAAGTVVAPPLTASDARPTTIRLNPGLSISGRVVDPDGIPIPGAQLTAWNGDLADDAIDDSSRGDWLERDGVMALWGGCRSDGRGEFEIDGLPDGRCVLDTRLANDDGVVTTRRRDVRTDERSLIVTLRRPDKKPKDPTVDVVVSLRDSKNDAPVVRALVELTTENESARFGGTAVGPGDFCCAGVPRGRFKIVVRATGFLRVAPIQFETDGIEKPQAVTIRLERGACVEGTVRLSDGSPLHDPHAGVVSIVGGTSDLATIDARSGRFVAQALAKDAYYRLWITDRLPDGTWRSLTTALGDEIPGTADGRNDWSTVLVPAGSVVVRTADHDDVIGRFEIVSADGKRAFGMDADGNNYGTPVPAGRYRVRRTTSKGVVEKAVEIGADAVQTVVFD